METFVDKSHEILKYNRPNFTCFPTKDNDL